MDSKNPSGDYGALTPQHVDCACHSTAPTRRSRLPLRILIFVVGVAIGFLQYRYFFSDRAPAPDSYPSQDIATLTYSPGIVFDHCEDWTDHSSAKWPRGPPLASSVELNFPISSDKLFLLARGQAAGSVEIQQGGDSDLARFEVVARYWKPGDLKNVAVCNVHREKGDGGIGIYGSGWDSPPPGRGVEFVATLTLPSSDHGSTLHLKDFETDMPLFAHLIGDLAPHTLFDSVSFKTANMPISVKSLRAQSGRVETMNSPITGSFNVSSSLALHTQNSPIDVVVNLNNNKDAHGEATEVKMYTSNSPIKAKLNMASERNTGGIFAIDGTTSNSPIDFAFLSAPIDSVLSLNAFTSIMPVKVKLHETYQGDFKLRTSLSSSKVINSGKAKDPTGQGRKRNIDVRTAGSSATGTISWSDEGVGLGTVDLETSISPVVLNL